MLSMGESIVMDLYRRMLDLYRRMLLSMGVDLYVNGCCQWDGWIYIDGCCQWVNQWVDLYRRMLSMGGSI